MAGEEDSELRDLVAQSLEAKGVLGKIRVSDTNVCSVTVNYLHNSHASYLM